MEKRSYCRRPYAAPKIEALELSVEKGFAASSGEFGPTPGGDLDPDWE